VSKILALIAAAGLAATPAATAEPAPTANKNVTRWATGTIAYRVKSTGVVNGYETWRLSVHPDGSRTMAATVQYAPRDIQRHVVQRVDAAFKPLEAYALYWIEGQWRGSAMVKASNKKLSVTASTPSGEQAQSFEIGDTLAIVPHVLATDSWRAMIYDKAKGGTQPIPAYNFNATGEGPMGLMGKVMSYNLTYVGAESVSVPAGTFATDHYRVEDAVDLFLTGPDGVLVKFIYPSIDREHHLIEYRSGP
jgi:hypothetical protein